jgi:hydroxymethylpyrimidine pyrophosphatase-like HAD family hydrolase
MNFKNAKLIAVDFDGTIVEDAYPKIGKPMIFAFETLKKLQSDGHRLILWTYRSGSKLDEAVAFCEKNGINFYAINNSFSGEEYTNDISRKINADVFIDDRNIGGFIGWGQIYQILTNETPKVSQKKKGIFGFLK